MRRSRGRHRTNAALWGIPWSLNHTEHVVACLITNEGDVQGDHIRGKLYLCSMMISGCFEAMIPNRWSQELYVCIYENCLAAFEPHSWKWFSWYLGMQYCRSATGDHDYVKCVHIAYINSRHPDYHTIESMNSVNTSTLAKTAWPVSVITSFHWHPRTSWDHTNYRYTNHEQGVIRSHPHHHHHPLQAICPLFDSPFWI